MSMKSILKKIYTNLRKKAIDPYIYSEKYVKLDDVYDEIYKAEKEYSEGLRCVEIRNKAIDDFAKKLKERMEDTRWTTIFDTSCIFENDKLDKCIKIVDEIAEQMKEV